MNIENIKGNEDMKKLKEEVQQNLMSSEAITDERGKTS